MTENIRIGIAGLSARGGWAATAHVPAIAAVEGLELRGVTASSLESAERSAQKHGVAHAFGSVGEMAASGEVDLIVVAVKVPDHRDLIMTTLDTGTSVLSEWPLARSSREAAELVDHADTSDVRTHVMLQARSSPALVYLRDLIREGYVGDVISTGIVAAGGNWGGTVDNTRLYQLDPESGFSMLSGPIGHTLDALVFVLGELSEVAATMGLLRPRELNVDTGEWVQNRVHDQIALTGRLSDGAVVSMQFRGGVPAGPGLRWEIVGTDGVIVATIDKGVPLIQIGRIELSAARGDERLLSPLEVPARYTRVSGVPDAAVNLAHAYLNLRDSARNEKSPAPDFTHAAGLHTVLAAIETAAATGATQRLGTPAAEASPNSTAACTTGECAAR
ncbi:Gfo/Idh/MocA family protein [Diaminobutyricibacter sp. McL0608]|uniref:Gfo/Idh/MocA family protein n=1 Tax=Leifsonia sp. McL0608 TaxID=3143537 RepID=UPI0031F325DE